MRDFRLTIRSKLPITFRVFASGAASSARKFLSANHSHCMSRSHPREVVHRALALNCASVILGHNHTSVRRSFEGVDPLFRQQRESERLPETALAAVCLGDGGPDRRYGSFDHWGKAILLVDFTWSRIVAKESDVSYV
jgi:hypothetical protein